VQSSGSSQVSSSGKFSGQRSTTAKGTNGSSYQGNTSYQNGSATHSREATNKSGDSYQGSTTATKGQGATHTGTCKNASGSVIPCKQ
jgi:hypothetical protein